MNSRKRLLVGLSFLLLAVMLVGAANAYAAPVKVKAMWNSATVALYEELIPLFEKEYPNIDVELVGVAFDDLPTKSLLAMIDPKGDYDLVLTSEVPRYATEGLLTDLYTLGEYDWDAFYAGTLADAVIDDSLYGLPIRLNTLGLVYNKKFFREAGIPYPDDNFTLADFEEAAQKFMTGDKYGFATWYKRSRLLTSPWAALMFSHGGQILDSENNPVFNQEQGVKALEQFVSYQKYGPPGMSNWDIDEVHEAFQRELVGMVWTWSSSFWAVAADPSQSVPAQTQDGEFMPLPMGDAFQGSIGSAWMLCIPENAPHKKEAWTFLSWACSDATQRVLVEMGQQSARIAICTDPEYLAQNRGFGGLARTWEVIGEGNMYLPRIPDSTAIQEILAEAISRAVVGERTAKQALDAAATEVRNTLAKKGYYK